MTLYKCIEETNVNVTLGFSGEKGDIGQKGDTGPSNEIEGDVDLSHRILDPLGKQA